MAAELRFNVKHPLQHHWVLWFDSPSKKATVKDWSENLKKLIVITTVEDFWGVFNYIAPASEIPLSANYHLFKEGIKPEWEDPQNSEGGKWSYIVGKGKKSELDKSWINLLMAAVGEQFTHGHDITGIVVSIRKAQDRIALWTKSWKDEAVCLSIG
eukprot:jgi/Hompol1/5355/HPOL_001470-RA